MIDRRSLPWIAGLGVLALAVLAAGVILLWISSDMNVRANEFYNGLTGADQLPERTYEYWNTVSTNAYRISNLVPALLLGAVVAAIALLAVLARHYDQRSRPRYGDEVFTEELE